MPDAISEILRLLSNLIRIGTVFAVDLSARPAKVRVSTGGLQTDWLQWREARAGSTTTWNPPTTGEQVIILCPGGDPAAGIVLAGLNSDAIPAPSDSPDEHVTVYPDGARIAYNHSAGALTATGITTLTAEVADTSTLKCPDIKLDGNVTVTGLLTYLAGMSGRPGKGNTTKITGTVTHEDGILSSNGVVLHTHRHRTQGLDALTTEPTQ
ncbi:phage baseplate assembly protein V [Achromobacter anxifer]|uniref:phage baseplate assembly protein V n=1 Tax=Achromobacter anxifer TaxID=1287737 RepID=UPI0023F95F57|nr:phage baseplate assembly protein V [Achromobacter anxifer]MDF8362020.1 phage baseplate assembly protein V [Achromobacter anxifer]